MIPGSLLFRLKATHGLPLDMALDRVTRVEWPSFIEAAREDGWPDFRTYDCLRYGLQDAFIPQSAKDAVLDGFKRYVMAHPQAV